MNISQESEIISEFLTSLGPWSKHIVIGGGYALFIYKLFLSGQENHIAPVGTRDIDSILPRKIPKASLKNISKHLNESGFSLIFKDVDIPATEAYVKEIDGVEIEIEFLTDSAVREDKYKNVMISGVVAQPLSYLSLSLQKTLEFRTHSSTSGRVVSPGAWMFHKGLTFPRRKSTSKLLKDLYGIWYVATQLGSFSTQAKEEFSILSSQHITWSKTLQKNLRNWIENASPSTWSNLETQDPSGSLKKLGFEQLMRFFTDLTDSQ